MNIREILSQKQLHVFDMDGTLVNLEELNRSSYSLTLKKFFSIDLTNSDYQKHFSGTRTARAFDGYLQEKGIDGYVVDDLIGDFRKKKEESLINYFNNCVSLISGSKDYLESLKNDRKTIVLATSTIKSFTEIILDGLSIKEYFDHIVTAEDVENGKPDPEIYNLSVLKASVSKELSVVYEDSKNGIDSAKTAGLLCVGIHTEGFNDTVVKSADYIVRSYGELL